jgi:zinc protease
MKKTRLREIISFIFVIHISLFIFPSAADALEVKRSVLQNGLTLLVVERHHLPIVKVTIGIRAGSLREPEEKAGLASLTAGLLTSGTKTRKASRINEEIEFVGASLSGSGGDDYITVQLSVLKKDIELGFDLLSDVIQNPLFPEDELDKKRERIKGSLKAREEDPGFVASREFKKAVFGTHPYGRLITGTAETLDMIKRNDLIDFHSRYYVPNNSLMAVVGDISSEEVGRLLDTYFSQWRLKKIEALLVKEPEKTKKGKTITVDKDLTQANIILGHGGIKRDNPDYYTVSVMNYILGGGGFASRLMQNIREEKGLKEILKEIKEIRSTMVSDIELSDAQAFLTGSFPMRIETSSRIANFLVAVEYYGLGIDYIENYPVFINAVTKKDVLRVAEKYLDPENIVLVVVADKDRVSVEKKIHKKGES